MKIKNKFMAYILIGFLSVSSLTSSYVQGVYAIEWLGGAIAFEEALKWILGALGIVVGTKVASDVWEEYGYQFKTFCSDTKDIALEEVTTFCDKLSRGILDKGSACWQALKEWASGLTSDSGESGGDVSYVDVGFYEGIPLNVLVDNINSAFGLNIESRGRTDSIDSCVVGFENGNFYKCIMFPSEGVYIYYSSSYSDGVYVRGYSSCFIAISSTDSMGTSNYNNHEFTEYRYSNESYITSNIVNESGLSFGILGVEDSPVTSDFVAIKKDVADLDIISSLTGDDAEDAEVAIPMPGVSAGDSAESASAYDDIVEGYQDGTVDLPTTIGDIQDVTKVIVIDDDTDTVFPTPEGEEPITKEDALEDIKDNMGFTLGGLETVFPFCIPWDLYSFLGLLVADPVAPSFVFPFRDPKTKQNINMTVDLSPFNSAAQVCRYGFDLVFIVGLAMVTRKLIGAGGDS